MSEKNELLLQDRIEKIRSVIGKYGEENFYISFSGGKDSTVLHYLMDMALPDNKIPRVYVDTGIELLSLQHYVYLMAAKDDRIHIVKTHKNIKQVLNDNGYPFKSKIHSKMVSIYQKYKTLEGRTGLQHYLNVATDGKEWSKQNRCPKSLEYQFTERNTLKISDKCCLELKEKPLTDWGKEHGKKYYINGIRTAEGGRREKSSCMYIRRGDLVGFQPLAIVSNDWEDWFLGTFNIKLCELYYLPYNFKRTGCKGCPFNRNLQGELDTLAKYFPAERKQCEYIWKPVYEEYRRIGYRLRKVDT